MKLLFLLVISYPLVSGNHTSKSINSIYTETYLNEKIEAYEILQSKCNMCHVKRNRSKIFTLKNMNGFASNINEQVFVKKRMPKGNILKLTEEERVKLKNWLNTLK